jgi:hypothetical protein
MITAKKSALAVVIAAFILLIPVAAAAEEYDYIPGPGSIEAPARVRSWTPAMLTNRTLTRREARVNIHNPIPVVSPAFGDEAEGLNEAIDAAVSDMIAEAARARARSITFSYDAYATQAVVSIVIFGDITTSISRTLVRSVNFCVESGMLLDMNAAMGVDVLSLAMRMLNERIRMFPERYYAALSASFDDQAFFIDYNRLVLLFDECRLSTRVADVNYIELELGRVRTYSLAPRYFHTTEDGYELKMIPVRRVAVELGYEVGWVPQTDAVTVRHGAVTIAELVPGTTIMGSAGRPLEAAPVRIGENVYVPITFFDQVLPLTTYSIADCGTITFVAYLGDAAPVPETAPSLFQGGNDFVMSGVFKW